MLEASSPISDNYRLFRDYLIADSEAAARYGHAKQVLARRYFAERGRYIAEKEQVVDALMAAQARKWRTTVETAGLAAPVHTDSPGPSIPEAD